MTVLSGLSKNDSPEWHSRGTTLGLFKNDGPDFLSSPRTKGGRGLNLRGITLKNLYSGVSGHHLEPKVKYDLLSLENGKIYKRSDPQSIEVEGWICLNTDFGGCRVHFLRIQSSISQLKVRLVYLLVVTAYILPQSFCIVRHSAAMRAVKSIPTWPESRGRDLFIGQTTILCLVGIQVRFYWFSFFYQ